MTIASRSLCGTCWRYNNDCPLEAQGTVDKCVEYRPIGDQSTAKLTPSANATEKPRRKSDNERIV